MTPPSPPPLPWLDEHDPLPSPLQAWGETSPAPGLLAAGGELSVARLKQAYGQGTFPWFSAGQPILWWCTNPRMVLQTASFRLHRSLRQAVKKFRDHPRAEIRFDSDFHAVIHACAQSPRPGQHGTWIVPAMVQAYEALHQAGHAHSVETWVEGQLVGGLYLVNLGCALFGESMFAHRTDASKIALSALVAWARQHDIAWIDCQQQTAHLARLGAQPIRVTEFLDAIQTARARPAPTWDFQPVYWDTLLSSPTQPPIAD
ncbi:MAG: leucyl/phenylalanyl-tRNA--protein transferase [Limnohabitans sp.]|nr:leucyl/phenylalanyl-tRNA--protein transferase [Limnohabitans sp.]